MRRLTKTLHTGRTHTIGGRDRGAARSSDGRLDIRLSSVGSARIGTNPEQLLAAAWSASFESAIAFVARNRKITLPAEMSIDAEVDLKVAENEDYFLSTRFNINVPGLDYDTAQALVNEANQICPYSKATRGNIEVTINVV